MVEQGVLPPLCNWFVLPDSTMNQVALASVHSILKMGHRIRLQNGLPHNPYATDVEACGALTKLDACLDHKVEEVSSTAQSILSEYFPDRVVVEEELAPADREPDRKHAHAMAVAGLHLPQMDADAFHFRPPSLAADPEKDDVEFDF
jgi:hypothetical protein